MNDTWYNLFFENLYEKFPKKAQLAEELITLLCIEREAVYRRLRKEVVFPTSEILKIASAWNISLDEIIGINSGLIPFQMQPINYLNPTKQEFFNFQKRTQRLEHLMQTEDSEYMEVGNKLPRPIYIASMTLYRFEIFKWAYQYIHDEEQKTFAETIIPHEVYKEFDNYSKYIRNVRNSYFIMDPMIFDNFVKNIQYFHSILLITDEEKELLKNKLFEMIDYLHEIANKGCYPDTLKKVHLYISQLNINTNYSYYSTDQLNECRIFAFGKFDVCSYDSDMVAQFKKWLNAKKRSAIQISETNIQNRIEFFMKQKQIVEEL
jgi:hypothetical protein